MGVIYETHSFAASSPLSLLQPFVSFRTLSSKWRKEKGREGREEEQKEEMAAITAAVKGGKESERIGQQQSV